MSDLGVTPDDVLGRLEFDGDLITETSSPFDLGDLRGWIEDCEAEIASKVAGAGLSVAGLGETDRAQASRAVIHAAIAECYGALGQRGTVRYTAARAEADRCIARLGKTAAFVSKSSSRTNTNANATAPTGRFSGRKYEF